MLPFTVEQFFAVFARYNQAIWPAQIIAYGVGLVALWLAYRNASRWVTIVLAAMWAWTGVAYHILAFASINTAAYVFGGLFVLEAGVLVYFGFIHDHLRFGWQSNFPTLMGGLLVGYSAVAYPLIGLALGHSWIELPAFGLTPCPVTIFTFGLLLMTTKRVPLTVQAIPFVWSLIGGSAAFLLNVPQDFALLGSGLVASGVLLARDRAQRPRPT